MLVTGVSNKITTCGLYSATSEIHEPASRQTKFASNKNDSFFDMKETVMMMY